jgi:hypothetical protein
MEDMANDRLRKTTRDMVLSLAVIGIPIAAVLLIEPSTPGSPVNAIGTTAFQQTLGAARVAEPFPLLVPHGLSSGWRATSETYQEPGNGPADWHVGYLAPDGGYVDLDQTTEPLGDFLNDQGSDATQGPQVQIGGKYWQYYSGTKPAALTTILVQDSGKYTVIVAGSAPLRELESFAQSLAAAG